MAKRQAKDQRGNGSGYIGVVADSMPYFESSVRLLRIRKSPSSGACGFRLTRSKWDPYPWVNSVDVGTPAYVCGLKAGDCILEVNGDDVLGLRIAEIAPLMSAGGSAAPVTLLLWRSNNDDVAAEPRTNPSCHPEDICRAPMPSSLQRLSVVLQSVLSIIECPICRDTILPPTMQCQNGHLLCLPCRIRAEQCPVCREHYTPRRALIAEQLYNAFASGFNLCQSEQKMRQLIFGTSPAMAATNRSDEGDSNGKLATDAQQPTCDLPLSRRRLAEPTCNLRQVSQQQQQQVVEQLLPQMSPTSVRPPALLFVGKRRPACQYRQPDTSFAHPSPLLLPTSMVSASVTSSSSGVYSELEDSSSMASSSSIGSINVDDDLLSLFPPVSIAESNTELYVAKATAVPVATCTQLTPQSSICRCPCACGLRDANDVSAALQQHSHSTNVTDAARVNVGVTEAQDQRRNSLEEEAQKLAIHRSAQSTTSKECRVRRGTQKAEAVTAVVGDIMMEIRLSDNKDDKTGSACSTRHGLYISACSNTAASSTCASTMPMTVQSIAATARCPEETAVRNDEIAEKEKIKVQGEHDKAVNNGVSDMAALLTSVGNSGVHKACNKVNCVLNGR